MSKGNRNIKKWPVYLKLTSGGKFLFQKNKIHVLKADRVQGGGFNQFLYLGGRARVEPTPGG